VLLEKALQRVHVRARVLCRQGVCAKGYCQRCRKVYDALRKRKQKEK
jgi:hypothetical protein